MSTPEQPTTAHALVLQAHRSGAGPGDLASRLSAWPWSSTYRSHSEADDAEHDPNALQAAFLARNLDLLTDAELERILQLAAARTRTSTPATVTASHARRHWRATLQLAHSASVEITVHGTPTVALMNVELARRALAALDAAES